MKTKKKEMRDKRKRRWLGFSFNYSLLSKYYKKTKSFIFRPKKRKKLTLLLQSKEKYGKILMLLTIRRM